MKRTMPKILSLMLAIIIAFNIAIPQGSGTHATAANRVATLAATDADKALRTLLAELTPESFSAAESALEAPQLDPLPAITNADSVTVTGSAPAGATITLTYGIDSGSTREEATAEADDAGRFNCQLWLDYEGVYRITATAELNGETSDASAPAVIEVDRTPPGEVTDENWLPAYPPESAVLLQWSPPRVSDGRGGVITDPDVVGYRIYDRAGLLLKETADTETLLDGLAPASAYDLQIQAVDRAGNVSGHRSVYAGTAPAGEVKLSDEQPAGTPLLIGDGTAVLYVAADQSQLHRIDTETGVDRVLTLTADGQAPNGSIKELAANRSGSVIAFVSNATNLDVANQPDGTRYAVYVYHADSGTLALVSDPAKEARDPSMNASGDLIVYAEDRQVYLHNLTTQTRTLVSGTDDGSFGNGASALPVISANGERIAYETRSTDLKGAPGDGPFYSNGIAIYDVASGLHIRMYDYRGSAYNLSISDDGKYVVFRGSLTGHKRVYAIDMRDANPENWTDDPFPDNRNASKRKDKSYETTSLSGDGRYVVAMLNDNNPEGSIYHSHYAERFDRESGEVTVVGNPALNIQSAQIDASGNRLLYVRGGEMYTYCYGECRQRQPGGAIETATWSVPAGDLASGYVIPGSTVTLMASANPGQVIMADVVFQEITEGNPSQTKTVKQSIAMTETPAESGLYRAVFTVAEGMAQIDAITARMFDNSATRSAGGLPLRVAGKLAIDVAAAYPDVLGSAWFDLRSPNASATRKPLSAGVTHYEYWWPEDNALELILTAADGTELARSESIVVNKGTVTTVNLSAASIASSLSVELTHHGTPITAEVTFKTEGGSTIAQVPTDSQGVARLKDRQAGERITVAVAPPSSFKTPNQQTVTLGIGGTELAISLERLSDVYALEFSSEVGNGSDKAPVIDSDLVLKVKAPAGHAVRAKLGKNVWQEDGTEVEAVEWVALTEMASAPGSYSGTFRIAEGTAALNGFVLELDGALQPQSYPIERRIASRLRIVIDAPPDDDDAIWLDNATLYVTHTGSPYFSSSKKVEGGGRSYTIDVPYANKEYQIFLSSRTSLGSYTLAVSSGSGQTSQATVVPQFPFEFRINAKKDGGTGGTFQATLRNAVSREVLWSGMFSTWTAVKITLPRRVAASESMELSIVATDPAYETETIVFPADNRSQSLDITLRKKPEAQIHGRVLGTDGKPAAGSAVTAVIGRDGFSGTYTAQTDANGEYSLRVPVGEVQLRAKSASGAGSLSKAHTLTVSGEQTVDLQLREQAAVTLRLYTRLGGGWDGPIELDTATNYHLYVSPNFGYTAFREGVYRAWATVGDSVSICVNGVEAGLPSMCREAVVGENNKADIEIRLENPGGQASFRAYDPDGKSVQTLRATLYDLASDVTKEELLYLDKERQRFFVPLASGGNKRLILRSLYQNTVASIDFTAQPGGVVALGDIHLQSAGSFSGAGNGLEAGTDWTTPGGRITVRAVYKNNNLLMDGMAQDAMMTIELPPEVEFAAGTLVLNGKAVEPTRSGSTLEIPIGDIARYVSGSMQLQLKIAAGTNAPQIAIVGKMKYKTGGPQTQIFGTAALSVTPVTLRAPATVVKPQLEVGGYAPAGSEVTVYDGGVAVGKAAVSRAGTWTLPITLVGSEAGKHQLTSEAAIDGIRSPGERAVVIYDPDDPGLEQVSMQQQMGRLVAFDPASGVAVFPYVVVPGRPFVFELKFRDVSRISDVYVQMGDRAAQAQLVGDRYRAVLPFTYNVGAISVDYRKKPAVDAAPAALPTEEAYRDGLPAPLANYEMEWRAGPGEKTPDGNVMSTGSASMRIRMNRNMTAQLSVNSSPASYSPSDKELQQAEAAGVPVYGFSVNRSMTDTRLTLRISGYVPEGSNQTATGADKRSGVRAFGFSGQMVMKTIEFTIDTAGFALTLRDLIQGTMDVADPDSFERRINDAIKIIDQMCDPAAKEYYSNFAWEVKADIFAHNMLKTGLGIASITFIPGGLFGIAFWGESYYIGLKLDEVANNELTELENHLRNYNDELCKKKPRKPPVAEPKYIWDPSGYVYEGMPENRVEGAIATVLEKNAATGEWDVWDADWYGQTNPLTTDARGQYGWDVPEGKWKVKYEKEGYVTAYSAELEVPPPQLEVNVPLVSYDPPQAQRAKAAPGGAYVDVYFSKPIDAASITSDAMAVSLESGGGQPIAGTVQAVNPVEANGKQLASVIRYTPGAALVDGDYKVAVSGTLASYAGVPTGSVAELRVRVTRRDEAAPGEAASLFAGVTFDKATVMWTDPSDDDYVKALVRWKKAGDAAYGAPVEVARGTEWVQIAGLPSASGFDFKVTTVDESGNESSGATASWAAAADWQAPLPATGLKAVNVTDRSIALAWNDPASASADLAKLRLSWAKAEQPDSMQEGEALPGAESFTITGLEPATDYTVSIVAIDRSGNVSSGAFVPIRTKSASPGGTGGGIVGGNTGANDPNAAEVRIPASGGSFQIFDGWVTLTAESGAYPDGTALKLSRKTEAGSPLAAGYTRISDTVEIASDDAANGKPLRLVIRLDPGVVGRADPRKLGIYKRDPESPTGWSYVGGVFDKTAYQIEAAISSDGAYAVLLYERTFTDLAAHWSRDEVGVLISRHLVDGVGADRFAPNRPITRAEVTKLLVSALQQSGGISADQGASSNGTAAGQPTSSFTDVSSQAWYAPYVETAAELGLVYGDHGRFRPNDPVTREELAVLLERFARMQGFASAEEQSSALDRFADSANISGWARDAIALAIQQRWMQGVTKNKLNPLGQASRAEAAALLLRVLTSLGDIER